jgi:hypothetical protein
MFLFLITFGFSVKVFSPVDPSDRIVVIAQSYLNSALSFLFPDAHGDPEIFLADKQRFTSSSTLTLSVKMLPRVWFRALVTVSPEGKAQLDGLEGLSVSERQGGYHWQNPATLTEADVKSLESLLRQQKRFTSSIAKILAFRVKVVSGTNQHFIFKDNRGELYAAVVSKGPELGEKIIYFVHQPTY